MPVQDECLARCDEIESLLKGVDEQWRLLQVRLEEAEENFLEGKLDSLKKWFYIDEVDLQNWNVGTLRHSIRDRLQRIIVAPITEKMMQRVGIAPSCEEEASWTVNKPTTANLIEELLNYFEVRVKPELGNAKIEDEKLSKKIRKTEKDETKAGVIALNGDTKKVAALKKQRLAVWETSQTVLEKLATPMKRVGTFFSDELSQDSAVRIIASVPSIVSRAICDYYFQRCTTDLDQIENWWRNTKATLQQKATIWDKLKEQEARLLRNVEMGLEELVSRRHRYNMYATFGGNEIEVLRDLSSQKLEESVTLLAGLVSEMHKRLRMIRDSALWRIIDSVQGIHKELKAEAANVEVWPTVGLEEGVLALAEAIGCPTEESSPSHASSSVMAMGEEELCEAALGVMDRLGKLVGLCLDVKDYFEKLVPTGCQGISATMDAVVARVSKVNEELICLLDDPSPVSVRAWLDQWSSISDVDEGQRIEATMSDLPLKHDNDLAAEPRKLRRHWLSLLRGVQVLLNTPAIRAWAVAPLAVVEPGSPAGSWKPPSEVAQVDVDDLAVSMPPSPRWVLLAPPGGGQVYRPPERKSLPGSGSPVDQGAAGVPMGSNSGWRAEAPSTTCEDGLEMRQGSRPGTPGKFVDGAYVSLRPNSASMRLPPLVSSTAPSSMAKPLKKA